MKSTLKNMVLVLLTITFIASLCVGLVHWITTDSIEHTKLENTRTALQQVLPPFEATRADSLELDGLPTVVYTATSGDAVVGYAVEALSGKGYGGLIRLMVGFTSTGEVYNVSVVEHNETPGLGSKMGDEGNPLLASIRGRNPSAMKLGVRKDGGEVDALTAATISSRAYVDAVGRAYNAMQQVTGRGAEASTGATNDESWSEEAPKGDDHE